MARGAPSRPGACHAVRRHARHPRDADLRSARHGGTAGGRRPDRARHRAGRPGRADAADQPGILHRLLRHPLRRRGAGADLSAGAAGADRGPPAPAGRHPAQCRRARPGHGAGRPAAGGAAARAGGYARRGGDRGAPVERQADRLAAGHRRSGDGLHPIHLRLDRRSQGRGAQPRQPGGQRALDDRGAAGHPRRRVRELAAALSRPRPDRRLDGHALSRRPALRHLAAQLPGPPAMLAQGDPPLARDAVGGAELRLRALPQPDPGFRARRAGPELVARRRQRRGADRRQHHAPLHREILPLRLPLRARCRRSTGWRRTRSASRSRRSAAGR